MTPQYMTDRDAAALGPLDIGLVIDFRGQRFPSSGPVPAEGGTRLALAPALQAQQQDAAYERYRLLPPEVALPEVLERYATPFAGALTAIAQQPETNVLFHCRLGKDRTGVFAALLLELLGVSDGDVAADYMLTQVYEPMCRKVLDEFEADELPDRREPLVAKSPASRTAIDGVLQRIESRYGGAREYFLHYGVPEALLDDFVERALEPAADE
jgi:protein-tyrosine phosphatase